MKLLYYYRGRIIVKISNLILRSNQGLYLYGIITPFKLIPVR